MTASCRRQWEKSQDALDYVSNLGCHCQGRCGDTCENTIMNYECMASICSSGEENCSNRQFSRLRASGGSLYHLDLIKTQDRGYGVRTQETIPPKSLIMEYTGDVRLPPLSMWHQVCTIFPRNAGGYTNSLRQPEREKVGRSFIIYNRATILT